MIKLKSFVGCDLHKKRCVEWWEIQLVSGKLYWSCLYEE